MLFLFCRSFSAGQQPLLVSVTAGLRKIETMRQVDVDEPNVQKQLGNINMDFVRKAEKRNKERAKMHRYQCCGSEFERIRKFWLDANPNLKKKFGVGSRHCCRI
jgi:hypothetical protein